MNRIAHLSLAGILVWSSATRAAALDVFVLSSKSTLDFTAAKTDEKIGTFLVLNPAATNLTAYLKFANDCNVQHFRRSILNIPLQSVRLSVNGVLQPAIWTRGTNCTAVLTWSPTGPPYEASYQIDILASWGAANMGIAGTYSESLSLTAIPTP